MTTDKKDTPASSPWDNVIAEINDRTETEEERLARDSKNSAEAVERLRGTLRRVGGNYHRSRRLGARNALGAVIGFLRSVGADTPEFLPLVELLGALDDAEDGIQNELLKASPYVGDAGKRPRGYHIKRAGAAAIVSLLVDAGRSVGDASNAVAKLTAGEMSAAQIENYRKELSSGRSSKRVIMLYDDLLDQWRRLPLNAEQRAAEAMLNLKKLFG
jgi:hypothetical protein